MRINSKFSKQRIQDISDYLVNRFDCIGKLDAIKFVKETYHTTDVKIIIKAYDKAYPA